MYFGSKCRLGNLNKTLFFVLTCLFLDFGFVWGVTATDTENFSKAPAKLSEMLKNSSKASIAIKAFCESTSFGVVHTADYYKRTYGTIAEAQSGEILKMRDISKGLSDIALMAGRNQFDPNECISIIKQLMVLEDKLYSRSSVGAGNITVANNVSLLIAGLTFHLLSNLKDYNDDRLDFLLAARYPKANDSVDHIKALFQQESQYLSKSRRRENIPFLIECIKEKHPEFIQQAEKKLGRVICGDDIDILHFPKK